MEVLFQNKDIYVTMDVIEIKGRQFNYEHLKRVVVSKHGTEMKNLIGGIVAFLVGLYLLISLKWTTVGWIITVIGLLFIALNFFAVKNGKVTTQVSMVFKPTHTGESNVESVLIDDYKEAVRLGNILKGVAGLP